MNPNDKQDVVLGYALLKEIWSLPSAANNANPNFSATRAALRLYGQFPQHLILSYICINLSLKEQLIQLSTVAHGILLVYQRQCSHTIYAVTVVHRHHDYDQECLLLHSKNEGR